MLQALQHGYEDVLPHVVPHESPVLGALSLGELLQAARSMQHLAEILGHERHELVAGQVVLA